MELLWGLSIADWAFVVWLSLAFRGSPFPVLPICYVDPQRQLSLACSRRGESPAPIRAARQRPDARDVVPDFLGRCLGQNAPHLRDVPASIPAALLLLLLPGSASLNFYLVMKYCCCFVFHTRRVPVLPTFYNPSWHLTATRSAFPFSRD